VFFRCSVKPVAAALLEDSPWIEATLKFRQDVALDFKQLMVMVLNQRESKVNGWTCIIL